MADIFAKEERVVDEAQSILDSGLISQPEAKDAFELLLASFQKLMKISRRLVRISDRTEAKMKEAHALINQQKADLEIAHSKLGKQAVILEEQVEERTKDLRLSQLKLEQLVERGIALSSEHQVEKLFDLILTSAKDISNADGGTLYIRKGDQLHFEIMHTSSLGIHLGGLEGGEIKLPPVNLIDPETGKRNEANVASYAAQEGTTIVIADAYNDDRFDFSGTKAFDESTGYRSKSFLTVPLKPRGKDVIGVLQLLNAKDEDTGEVIDFDPGVRSFVEALASQAAVALDNQSLLEAQKNLLDAFIKLIAGAIDTKSPYTGGHCERVPELAVQLAEVACAADHGSFADFNFATEDEWREFRIGAWLHDCGKVTTPEYVVDKATKLETIYNRIHEVRMRFEVLLRDAELDYYRDLVAGGDEAELKTVLERKCQQIQDDFNFVAESNVGGEFMDDGRIERLEHIASQTWTRNLDDRLGLSHEEERRKAREPQQKGPVKEKLLSDKIEHLIERSTTNPFGDNDHGFDIEVPEHLYNLGEMYNLRIARGTLTNEERFKIQEHVIQTIIMLNDLPLPNHMKKIPEYAGTHHETMDGKGYPCKLTKDEMCVPARIMAIADVFEALTASDRPYKKAKSLSEAVRIMGFMRKDEHIDGELFELFLQSGVYLDYANMYLQPAQIDTVDIEQYIQRG